MHWCMCICTRGKTRIKIGHWANILTWNWWILRNLSSKIHLGFTKVWLDVTDLPHKVPDLFQTNRLISGDSVSGIWINTFHHFIVWKVLWVSSINKCILKCLGINSYSHLFVWGAILCRGCWVFFWREEKASKSLGFFLLFAVRVHFFVHVF